MKTIALIPARLAASRFPSKLIQILGDKTVIEHTFLNTLYTQLFDEVAVVTDSDEIESIIKNAGGRVYRSSREYECGSDRIAEYAKEYSQEDIIINVQGDEPFTSVGILKMLVDEMKAHPALEAASLMHVIDEKDADNPNMVKVVTDIRGNALLFSRSRIPYKRAEDIAFYYYKHIGIYAFRQNVLMDFSKWSPTILEQVEKLEGLRLVAHGIKIKMLLTDQATQGIDTPEDLQKARLSLGDL